MVLPHVLTEVGDEAHPLAGNDNLRVVPHLSPECHQGDPLDVMLESAPPPDRGIDTKLRALSADDQEIPFREHLSPGRNA
jgi:hypothetical protein